ncbi:MAG: hypothetical protein ABI867_11950 [Kofleriaceae bacterium]
MMRAAWLVVLSACGGGTSIAGLDVQLAAVSLAQDCGDAAIPPAPKQPRATAAAELSQDMAKCAGAGCAPACDPTSMQLSVRADRAGAFRIAKVELLDDSGGFLQVLTPRVPARWTGGAYAPWDQTLAGETVLASYLLSRPDWSKLTNAHKRKFQLRVTYAFGNAEGTVEKSSIIPAIPDPDVVTVNERQTTWASLQSS